MKKRLFLIVLVLIALITTTGFRRFPKLKLDENVWEEQWVFNYIPGQPEGEGVFSLDVHLLLHRGIARAAQRSGKFSIQITATAPDGHTWQTSKPITFDDEGWDRRQRYIPITGVLEWNGDDDGSGIISRLTLTLLGPSGKAMGPTLIEDTGSLFFYGPEYPGLPPGCGDEFPCPGGP